VDAAGLSAVYPGAALMADDISQLYGHHGNEPHSFDVLNARQGSSLSFARAGDPQILNLFAVNYLIVQAEDDPVDPVENSIVYHAALRKAGVPVELHLYAQGGHAFGLRPNGQPITDWPRLAEAWLATIGMTPSQR